MNEQEYFEQFSGIDLGQYCEYCGGFIPLGSCHIVSFRGTEYLKCAPSTTIIRNDFDMKRFQREYIDRWRQDHELPPRDWSALEAVADDH